MGVLSEPFSFPWIGSAGVRKRSGDLYSGYCPAGGSTAQSVFAVLGLPCQLAIADARTFALASEPNGERAGNAIGADGFFAAPHA